MFGLNPDTYRAIKQVLARFPLIDRAIIYGSRAKGTEHLGSDIDLILIGRELTLDNSVFPLREAIEDLYLPYSFDISIFETLNHAGLIDHINRAGKTFYQKPQISLSEPSSKGKAWKKKPLGELCSILDKPRKPAAKKDRKPGKYPLYGASGIVDYIDDFIFAKRLVLVGEDGAKWKSGEKTAFIAKGKYWVDNHVHVLEPHADTLLDSWLVYYLTELDLKKWTKGLAGPKLNQEQLKSIPIPLPPLSEQKSIVARLDSVFEQIDLAIAATEKRLAEIEDLKSAALQSKLAEKTGLKSFKMEKLGKLADVSTGNCAPQDKRLFENGSHFFIRTSDVEKIKVGRINSSQALLNDDGMKELRLFPKGTILFPKSGASTLLDCRAIMTVAGYVSSDLAAIKADDEKISDRYLFYFLQTINTSELLADSTCPSLQTKAISNISAPLPSIPEQKRIVAKLDEIFENASLATQGINRQLECYRTLKSEILTSELQQASHE